MQKLRAALICSTILLAYPANAGEDVLYGAAPDWVEEVDLQPLIEQDGPAQLLYDMQIRLEDGVEANFADSARRLENPQSVTDAGTIAVEWVPDNGDLTVHRLEIHRGVEVIDLLQQGVTFDAIRREQALEQRFIDGRFTASLAVPGLREDDILRFSYSITNDERAFGDEVQAIQYLPSEPWQVGFSRVVASWPADEEMYYSAEERVILPELQERGGYNFLEVSLPLAEREPIPQDAPFRFRRPDILRIGSFADWQEVSRELAPHFDEAAQFSETSELASLADGIMAQTSDPLERMSLAVRLVQDEVSYLFVGLDGGGFMPQSAEMTWEYRYGDCKAKSVLLTAFLRYMDIDAEVVLVNIEGGDIYSEVLPLPAFNHMIVHAVVDGTDYWLDGTSTATRLGNIGDVPPFHYALPLRPEGADLTPMVQRDLAQPRMAMDIAMDHSAGIDLPTLFEIEIKATGAMGAPLRAMVDADNPDYLRQMAANMGGRSGLQGALVSNFEIEYDEELAVATMRVEGVAGTLFEWSDGRMQMEVDRSNSVGGFNPDRARQAWRHIPVATRGPSRERYVSRVILPDAGEGFSLVGEVPPEAGFGNVRIVQRAEISEGVLHAEAETFSMLGEIPANQLGAVKRQARRLENTSLELVTPEDLNWRWELSEDERQILAQPLLEAYNQAIEFAADDDYRPLQARALFQTSIYDFEAALEDFNVLVDETPSPWALHSRSSVLEALGRYEEAIADLEMAYELDPANGTAFALARILAYQGRTAEAEEILGYLPVGDEDELAMADIMATVSGLSGDLAGGLSMLAEQVDRNPVSGDVLNSDCWYRGLFNAGLSDALELCTRAVERAEYAAAPLDSRALVRYRLGDLDRALVDLDAALELAPWLAPSLYLRGVVRLEAGDEAGEQDIATALGMAPQLERFYSQHGIVPPS